MLTTPALFRKETVLMKKTFIHALALLAVPAIVLGLLIFRPQMFRQVRTSDAE